MMRDEIEKQLRSEGIEAAWDNFNPEERDFFIYLVQRNAPIKITTGLAADLCSFVGTTLYLGGDAADIFGLMDRTWTPLEDNKERWCEISYPQMLGYLKLLEYPV